MVNKCYVGFIVLFNLLNISCSAEVTSPIYHSENGRTPSQLVRDFGDNHYTLERNYNRRIPTEKIKYISDISEMISISTNFHNPDIDSEMKDLKVALQYYIYSIIDGDINKKINSYKEYARSYNQLQILKEHLSDDDIEIMDQYLIRIRVNVNSLEYLE